MIVGNCGALGVCAFIAVGLLLGSAIATTVSSSPRFSQTQEKIFHWAYRNFRRVSNLGFFLSECGEKRLVTC